MATSDFTIADVLEWARTKPAGEAYNFYKSDVCALGQFACEMRGVSKGDAACGIYNERLSPGLLEAANATSDECTFGAFVMRLEALVRETPPAPSDWLKIDAYLSDIELAREGQSA